MPEFDWNAVSRKKVAKDVKAPAHWPEGVKPISELGRYFLGIHEVTGHLYWDGEEIVTKPKNP